MAWMQALYLDDGSITYLSDYPVPFPTSDQALIRITCAGICSTDLELVRGYAGFKGVPGHEFGAAVTVPNASLKDLSTAQIGLFSVLSIMMEPTQISSFCQ
jgi:D-arabinose 1-dehydrogenase-like Zn-dependent alcohol dehydrogenase